MSTPNPRQAPPVELLPDATMRCGYLIARPMRLPARRVFKDVPREPTSPQSGAYTYEVCDIGPFATAHSWSVNDRLCALNAYDLVCLAALVDEVGR